MFKLNYIIAIDLPIKEISYLQKNNKNEQLVLLTDKVTAKELGKWPAEQCILICGDRDILKLAKKSGMAVLGYLPPEQENFLPEAAFCAESMEEVTPLFLQRVYERAHKIPWEILETKRCRVREFTMADMDALFELYAGEGMTDYIEPLYPYEKECKYQQAYIENMYGYFGYGMWLVCDKKTGVVIGRAGVEHREELDGMLELGYAIGVPYQRKGIATEICTAILEYVRRELECEEVVCLIEPENTVSVHLVEKLGFVYAEELNISGKNMKKYRIRFAH